MSKPCRRPTRAAIKGLRSTKKQQEKALNLKLSATGPLPNAPVPLPNRCSTFTTTAEEQAAREEAVSQQMRLLRKELPAMLAQLVQVHRINDQPLYPVWLGHATGRACVGHCGTS